MIIKIETASDLRRQFETVGRDYFSYDGYDALLDYYSEDSECDPIEICGEWTEYGNADCSFDYDNLINDYGHLLSFDEWKEENDSYDEDDFIENLIKEIERTTTVIRLNNSVLIAD